MLKYVFWVLLPLTIIGSNAQAQTDTAIYARLKYMVSFLASDSMQGRNPGTLEEKKSADFLAGEIKRTKGIQLFRQRFSFYDSLTAKSYSSMNVAGFIPHHRDSTIFLFAHYDHIGTGGPLSLDYLKTCIHNGADDNASGVALVLSLLVELKKLSRYNMMVCFFSGHEMGLYGSNYFFDHIKPSWGHPALVLNFDMVGRLAKVNPILKIWGGENCSQWFPYLKSYNDSSLQLRLADDSYLYNLDTRSFAKAGVPCLSFTTGVHDDYHKCSDDMDKINVEGMVRIRSFLLGFLHQL